tara:strand:- start:1663 stop:2211 length:549 start_codon:yes stop_codon:yes gene_type:complete
MQGLREQKEKFKELVDHIREQEKTLKGALSKFQKLNITALKDSTNPHFKSKYADLTSVINAVNYGAEFGLSFSQSIDYKNVLLEKEQTRTNKDKDIVTQKYQDIHRDIFVTTTVYHNDTDEKLTCCVPVIVNSEHKDNPQKMGSAITYAKRYGLQSLYGLASDDDGNEASKKTETKEYSIDG